MPVYDLSFMRSFLYPEEWLKEAERYGPNDSYVISDSSWAYEPMLPIPRISICDLWKRTAKNYPQDTAVVFLDKKISYKDMDLMIDKYASLLLDLGIEKGDVVATMLPNSLQHWIAFYGANRIGAVHTPINVMYREREIEYQIKDSGAKALVTFDLFYQLYFAKLREKLKIDSFIVTNIKDFVAPDFNPEVLGRLKPFWDTPKTKIEGTTDLFEAMERYEPTNIQVEIDPKEDMSLLLYTAGTTAAEPKGVMCTHFNLVFNSLSHTHPGRFFEEKPINYSIMPMFHTAGYFLAGLPTFYQGGMVIPIPIFDAEDTLRVIQDYRVNTIIGPPTFYIALLQHPKITQYDLTSLRRTIAAGAPVPLAVQEQWNKLCPTILENGWGMTETNSGGCGPVVGKKFKLDSIGVPVASEMKICDDEGNVVPRGETGEIYYRGLQVAKGYWNKPQETKATFLEDGWMKTGDLGYIDEESFVHFVDRKKDLIVASGYNIAPVEVENVIYGHPAVLETAVIGITDPYRGETVKAFISLKEGFKGKVTEQEIIDHCKGKLATFKVPRVVEFVDEIPKNLVGKALRRVLREREAKK